MYVLRPAGPDLGAGNPDIRPGRQIKGRHFGRDS